MHIGSQPKGNCAHYDHYGALQYLSIPCGSLWIDGMKMKSLSWWEACLCHAMWSIATKSGVAWALIFQSSLRAATSTWDSETNPKYEVLTDILYNFAGFERLVVSLVVLFSLFAQMSGSDKWRMPGGLLVIAVQPIYLCDPPGHSSWALIGEASL